MSSTRLQPIEDHWRSLEPKSHFKGTKATQGYPWRSALSRSASWKIGEPPTNYGTSQLEIPVYWILKWFKMVFYGFSQGGPLPVPGVFPNLFGFSRLRWPEDRISTSFSLSFYGSQCDMALWNQISWPVDFQWKHRQSPDLPDPGPTRVCWMFRPIIPPDLSTLRYCQKCRVFAGLVNIAICFKNHDMI